LNYHDLSLSLVEGLLRSHGAKPGPREPPHVPFCITISREAGARGTSVATAIGQRLHWPVYDKEILDKIGEEMRRPPRQLEAVDERPGNWLEECLSGLLSKYPVSADAYFKYLLGTVRGLGAVGHCVIVGRGANYILPGASTLRVRLVASREDRVRVMTDQLGLSEHDAATWVERTERQRVEFVKHYFGKDVADPHAYDLVLNMSRVSTEDGAEIIIQLLRQFEGRSVLASVKQQPQGV
jgi:Cytidylate kinase-like family